MHYPKYCDGLEGFLYILSRPFGIPSFKGVPYNLSQTFVVFFVCLFCFKAPITQIVLDGTVSCFLNVNNSSQKETYNLWSWLAGWLLILCLSSVFFFHLIYPGLAMLGCFLGFSCPLCSIYVSVIQCRVGY